MPPDLLKAHQNLDKAVMKLYGFPLKEFTESDCVACAYGDVSKADTGESMTLE